MVIFKRKISKWKFWKRERFCVPSCFEELTFNQVLALNDKKTINEVVGFDLPVDLYPFLTWIYDPLNFDKIEPKKYLTINGDIFFLPDIRKKPFGKKILLSEIFKKKDENISYICKALSLYLTDEMNEESFNSLENEIKKMPFVDVYSCFLSLLEQWSMIVKMENNLPKTFSTHEQNEAGLGKLKELGDFNILDLISVRNGYKISEVELLDYNTVYLLIFRINELDNYEKRLKKIYDNKRAN